MSIIQNAINANTITPLALFQGGTSADLVASAGGIVWSNSTEMQILAGNATAGLLLVSGASASPAWLATADSSVLITSGSGVPSWSTTLPDGINIGAAKASSLQFANNTGILDANGNPILLFETAASAVNYLTVTNNASGSPVAISADGSDTNVSIDLIVKGAGQFEFYSEALSNQIGFNVGSTEMAITNFTFSPVTGTYDITFPAASGTVALTSGASGIVNSGLINQLAWYAASGTTLSGLATAASGVLVTSSGSVPSISTTLPDGLAMGTPTSLTLTNATGLPIAGITGFGTGVATALAANVNGSGSISLTTSPTFVTPILGAASATSINFGGTSLSTYLQGTWTPVLTSSGGGTATYSLQAGSYTQIGNRISFELTLFVSALPSSGNVTISGLPVAAGSDRSSCVVYCSGLQTTITSPLLAFITPTSSSINLNTYATGSASTLTVANCTTSLQLIISGIYHT